MAADSVPRRPTCPTKAFNLQSRGASLDTTAAGSVQWSSYSSSSASCAGHASPVLDTSSTLIYLDWDDTLFPSTEIFDRWGLQHEADKDSEISPEQAELLRAWGESLQRFMKACVEYSGSCVIVTNAQSRWVQNCLKRFAPDLISLFASAGGPTVLYAKEVLKALRLRKKVRHQDDSVIPAKHIDAYWDEEDTQRFKFVEMSAAKFHAMKLEFLDFFSGREGHSRCNIINFGDMEYEHEAVRELGMRMSQFQPEPHVKSLLLPEAPKISELTLRLELLRLLLPAIVRHDSDIDLDLKEVPSPMQLLSKALRLPELGSVDLAHAFGDGPPPREDEVANSLVEVAMALQTSSA
ncbi:agaA [Symbiodinium pilosum]|uniref:AgaA protein n=1 Tax=Symbiodinium pilosum TaxID=2952 RepID=A0A812RRD0_SYMPI|nr:agaA [Symbiodinium pilosum]